MVCFNLKSMLLSYLQKKNGIICEVEYGNMDIFFSNHKTFKKDQSDAA